MNNTLAQNGIYLLKALLISYIVTGAMLLMLALGLYKFQTSETIVNMGIMITYGLSNLIGAKIYAGKVGKRRILCGILLSLVYLIILIVVSLIVNRGVIEEGQSLIKAVVISLIGGAAGGFISPVKE